MGRFIIFSFPHSGATKKLYLTKKQQEEIYRSKEINSEIHFVILTTCYRTDILVWSEGNSEELGKVFKKHIPGFASAFSRCRIIRGRLARMYFLRVFMGLESTLIGETEIVKQVRDSFGFSRRENRLNKELSEILKITRKIAKEMRNKFQLDRGSFSHAYLAFRRALIHCEQKALILLCGFGDTTQKIAKYFYKRGGFEMIFFTGHLQSSAVDFIQKEKLTGAKVESYLNLKKYLKDSDCIFLATNNKKRPILREKYLSVLRSREKPLFVCDLSISPDCEKALQKHQKIIYCNIVDLDEEVRQNQLTKKCQKTAFLKFSRQNELFNPKR